MWLSSGWLQPTITSLRKLDEEFRAMICGGFNGHTADHLSKMLNIPPVGLQGLPHPGTQ